MAIILGWGKVGHPDTMSEILQQAKMSIVSNQVCQKESYPPIRIPVSESIINLGNGIKYFQVSTNYSLVWIFSTKVFQEVKK